MSLGTHKNENVSKFVLYYGISSLNGKRSQLGLENLEEKDFWHNIKMRRKALKRK
jgi:hypothetical protein